MNTKQQGSHTPQFKPVNPFSTPPVELGGSQTPDKPQSLSDHLDSAMNFVADSLFGFGGASDSGNSSSTSNSTSDSTSPGESNNSFADALRKSQEKNQNLEGELKKQKHTAKHKEMQLTEVFDLEKKKSEEAIKQIKNQLTILIKQVDKMRGGVDQSTHTAVFQGRGEAGKYYENFFEKLLNFLILLTQKVKEGNSWLQHFNKKKGKSKYQQNSSKYGSQYMFGQEGQGLTRQTG